MKNIFSHPTYRYFYQLLWLYVIISLILSGCAAVNNPYVSPPIADGDVWTLYYGSARYIVDGAIAFEPFSQIWQSPDGKLYVFARPIAQGWGWVIAKSELVLSEMKFDTGNYACCSTWSNLKAWMENNQWVLLSGGLSTKLQQIASGINEMKLAPIFLFPSSLEDMYWQYENYGKTTIE